MWGSDADAVDVCCLPSGSIETSRASGSTSVFSAAAVRWLHKRVLNIPQVAKDKRVKIVHSHLDFLKGRRKEEASEKKVVVVNSYIASVWFLFISNSSYRLKGYA